LVFAALQISYITCGFQDPGIITPSFEINLGEREYCSKCGAMKGGVHCNICDVCVEGLDHHCGFIGKCVGKKNLMSFYALLVSFFLGVIIIVLTLAWSTFLIKKP
jgi:DHHC palmitoyltransferase